MNEVPVFKLDGYLLSLRRLSGNKSDFWAEIVDIEGDVENSFCSQMKEREIELNRKEYVGYKEIEIYLETQLNEKLNLSEGSLVNMFVWDIVEFLQQAFSVNELEYDPIRLKESFLIMAMSEFHGNFHYIVVPFKGKAIAMGMVNRS
ncbi:MAG: hypothetical protein JAZ17_06355 [Candidatus Thiodiazotropha endolucinida]|nr:hypothetical protein [Candidatus Thiodiazotropha endolucinida]